MMSEREALKLALEALKDISSHYMSLPKKGCMALAAIEEALAQPEQEPVAWMESPHGAIKANPLYKISAPQSVAWRIPLYTTPPHKE